MSNEIIAEYRGVSRFWREAVGVVFLFLGLFLTLSLVRYSPTDPGIGSGSINVEVRNFGGLVGAKLSDLLVQSIGVIAFIFPLVLMYCAWLLFLKKKVSHLSWKLGAFIPWILILASIIDLVWNKIEIMGDEMESGGVLGSLISNGLTGLFNRPGAGVILVMIWILLTMLTTGGSFVAAAKWLGTKFNFVSSKIAVVAAAIGEHWSRRKSQTIKPDDDREKRKPTIIVDKPLPPPPPLTVPQKPDKSLKIKEKEPQKERFAPFELEHAEYELPSLNLLDDPPEREMKIDREMIMNNARVLEKKLGDYGVKGEVTEVHPGPVITTYEFLPAPGVKVNKISNLSDDLSLALSAINVRIVAPIPGKGVVGIEIPNKERVTVYLKEIIGCEEFAKMKSKLALSLGKDTEGFSSIVNLQKMPHLLVAGATGAGKSVSLNAMIISVLYKATPELVRFIMIDMKRLELGIYDGIPHLLHPVITDTKEAGAALKWAVAQMEERYRLMAEAGVRNIDGYNKFAREKLEEAEKKKNENPEKSAEATVGSEAESEWSGGSGEAKPKALLKPLPFIVVIIDELADLMMIAAREVEESIARLAQMARAAGIHLILATQRPSVDVVTGLIKANFPARISFQVVSRIDSRTIIDGGGAERLLGSGDMLLMTPGAALKRIHGAYVSENEIGRIVEFLKTTGEPEYDASIVVPQDEEIDGEVFDDYDEKYDEAVHIVTQTRQASISMIQRRLRVGYNRAARMIERMEREGIVGPSDGVRPRNVLVDPINMEK